MSEPIFFSFSIVLESLRIHIYLYTSIVLWTLFTQCTANCCVSNLTTFTANFYYNYNIKYNINLSINYGEKVESYFLLGFNLVPVFSLALILRFDLFVLIHYTTFIYSEPIYWVVQTCRSICAIKVIRSFALLFASLFCIIHFLIGLLGPVQAIVNCELFINWQAIIYYIGKKLRKLIGLEIFWFTDSRLLIMVKGINSEPNLIIEWSTKWV